MRDESPSSHDAAVPGQPMPPVATSRRGFLTAAAAAGAFLALGRVSPGRTLALRSTPGGQHASGAPAGTQPAPAEAGAAGASVEPPFTISLAEWSLHKALFAGTLGADDFPRVAKHDFGIDAIEHVSVFLKDHVHDERRLAALRRRADDLGVASLLIMVDGEGALGDADAAARAAAIENHVKWLHAAHVLGCHSIRVNAYGSGTPEEHAAQAADSLHRLADLGGGLNVIVENHGGLSSNGEWLAGVMRRANDPRVGTLPDFGNFRIDEQHEYDRYVGVEQMLPFAKSVSAKSYAFDAAGNETTIDYARMLKLVLAGGYHGHLGIEYEGEQLSERAGIAATLALLRRLQVQLA